MAKLQPPIDYMAKDYESFRQLMLDRLSSTLPAWQERHAPDLGVTLVEALAYVADYLSYYQDAVATEAYLGTARQRISVRRHARLLDYFLHEGCNARAWVHCCVNVDNGWPVRFEPGDLIFAATNERIGAELPLLSKENLSVRPEASYEIFKPVDSEPIKLHPDHNEFTVVGPLEKDATAAKVQLRPGVVLEAGSVLMLKAAKPDTAGQSEPYLYHPVALAEGASSTKLETTETWIRWHFDDALPSYMANLKPIVALGNIILVDHGRWVSDTVPLARDLTGSSAENPIERRSGAGPLSRLSLTHRVPLAATIGSAAAMLNQNPRQAIPQISLKIDGKPWGHVRADLLESLPYDRHFCVEVDDDGRAWIRFGDGEGVGEQPAVEASVEAVYRVGNGQAGNVPAGSINRLMIEGIRLPDRMRVLADLERITVTNPMDATGGKDPESAASARLIAPGEMRVHQQRAISAEDYAEFARNVTGVANAAATIAHEGAQRVVRVAIDPKGWEVPDRAASAVDRAMWAALKQHVLERLEAVRRINHDVVVAAPIYIDLDIELELSILSGYMQDVVLSQAQRKLVGVEGFQKRDSEEKAFFDADSLTFGQSIYWSQIVACLHSVPGVASVKQRKFGRQGTSTSGSQSQLIDKIEIGPYEIAAGPNWNRNLVVKVEQP
ncbi:putative baseplate assembly protein [Rhizobium leguminosarum]|uniref:putative baseplate assembly protein n=1 Tax=Rhizobium leguminosarum TaxID=384 RepID=UPI00103C38BF|nr:putative baseplate assembly protein [Rhizobium leguminosarum]MBY5530186.1 putative baseplate assembly protein [Rhizobium leguminosarum]TBY30658.1 putative baseplate assembly protein [Rhizobium leguminosarum bv. viciae]TBY35732.1 putative baseplate assembly protein [Rhizobium leguminosarum bv. viciae]